MGGSGTALGVDADLEAGVDQRTLDDLDHAAAATPGSVMMSALLGAQLLGLGADLGDAADAGDERLRRPVDSDLHVHDGLSFAP